jgi:hypothetical protein
MAGTAPADTFDSLQAAFTDQRAIAANHILTAKALKDGFPNTETLMTMKKTEDTLRGRKEELEREIRTLETTAAAADVTFTDTAPPLTGQPREKVYTLQDYILAILITTFTFAFIAAFFYNGQKTNWDKKVMSYMIGGGIILVALGFSLIRAYA